MFAATAFPLLACASRNLIDGLAGSASFPIYSYGLVVILWLHRRQRCWRWPHDNKIPAINGGKPVPDVSTTQSLTVITIVLLITTAASF